eukprot:3539986-Amphidinium_carterae.1
MAAHLVHFRLSRGKPSALEQNTNADKVARLDAERCKELCSNEQNHFAGSGSNNSILRTG